MSAERCARRAVTRRARSSKRWAWPWLHWCMFDRECRYWGVPARVHVWPLSLLIEIREEPLPIPDWPLIGKRPPPELR
jgi:hypothetical protein